MENKDKKCFGPKEKFVWQPLQPTLQPMPNYLTGDSLDSPNRPHWWCALFSWKLVHSFGDLEIHLVSAAALIAVGISKHAFYFSGPTLFLVVEWDTVFSLWLQQTPFSGTCLWVQSCVVMCPEVNQFVDLTSVVYAICSLVTKYSLFFWSTYYYFYLIYLNFFLEMT